MFTLSLLGTWDLGQSVCFSYENHSYHFMDFMAFRNVWNFKIELFDTRNFEIELFDVLYGIFGVSQIHHEG